MHRSGKQESRKGVYTCLKRRRRATGYKAMVMNSVPVIFCHGLESGPVGRKSMAIKDAGFNLINPDFRGQVLRNRLERAEPVIAEHENPVLVGSSYGGLVALMGTHRALARGQSIRGLLLVAPALHLTETPVTEDVLVPPAVPTIVIHGVEDEVVPISVSRQFAEKGEVELIETGDGHRLAGSLEVIIDALSRLVG